MPGSTVRVLGLVAITLLGFAVIAVCASLGADAGLVATGMAVPVLGDALPRLVRGARTRRRTTSRT